MKRQGELVVLTLLDGAGEDEEQPQLSTYRADTVIVRRGGTRGL